MVINIVILGSGGTIPTLSRNLPSTAIQCDGRIFLFDCGEGTQTQIIRSNLSMGKIDNIFISHMHGDHVMGLPGLLMTMGQTPREHPVKIFGPPGIAEFIEGNQRFLRFQHQIPLEIHESKGGILFNDEELMVEAAPADHSCFTLAFALKEHERPGRFLLDEAEQLGIPPGPLYGHLQSGKTVTLDNGRVIKPEQVMGPTRQGRKIVYATDTRPCDPVTKLAYKADILIHDGMFDDELRDQARIKCHSTVVQAARVAKRAKVKRLVLTHISTRYFQVKPLLEQARKVFPSTKMAKDLMKVNIPMYK